jgi:hypothetical protein
MACIDEVQITVTSLNAFFLVFIAVTAIVQRALENVVCVCVFVMNQQSVCQLSFFVLTAG